MKRQEQIEKAATAKSRGETPYYYDAFVEGAEWADAHPHWISVEDELPKEHGAYLVFNSVSSTQDIYVYSNGNWWYNAFKCPSGVITHWMRLPKKPILSNSENIEKDLKGGEV